MTPNDFYRQLATMQPQHLELKLSPGPLCMKIGPADIHAAQLILWLEKQMPETTTFGEMNDTLDAAKWWFTFWHGLSKEKKGGTE